MRLVAATQHRHLYCWHPLWSETAPWDLGLQALEHSFHIIKSFLTMIWPMKRNIWTHKVSQRSSYLWTHKVSQTKILVIPYHTKESGKAPLCSGSRKHLNGLHFCHYRPHFTLPNHLTQVCHRGYSKLTLCQIHYEVSPSQVIKQGLDALQMLRPRVAIHHYTIYIHSTSLEPRNHPVY